MSTTILGLKNDAAAGQVIPSLSWNDNADTVDNQLGELVDLIGLNGVQSGWTLTSTGEGLNVAAGEGWVGGAHCKTTGTQAITGITEDTTLYYIFAQRKTPATGRVSTSFTTGSVDFVGNITGVAPSNSILIGTGTTDGDHSKFSSVSNTPTLKTNLKTPLSGISKVVADTGTINTEFAVVHGLGYVPTGYLVTRKDKACDIYTSTGGTAWTEDTIYLKSSVANCAITLEVF